MSTTTHTRRQTRERYLGVARILAILLVLPLVATFAFMASEEWSFLDSLYMSVITLTTVGFQEVHPLSPAGRIIVILYLIVGLGAFLFAAAQMGELVVGGQLGGLREKRRMKAAIDKLKEHVIVCGYGRVGRRLCAQLGASEQDFVVIDRDGQAIAEAREEGLLAVSGDATDDSQLEGAGLERARGLAAVLPSDADNLYVVLSGRLLNPKVQILARATDEKVAEKLERAGANRVVSLYETSAMKMANLLINPDLEDFMQVFTSQGRKLTLAEISVKEDAPFCNKTLAETDFNRRGILVVGHQRPGKRIVLPPRPNDRIETGDTLIAFGDASAISELFSVP
jgi:voltage-gated potassium channel